MQADTVTQLYAKTLEELKATILPGGESVYSFGGHADLEIWAETLRNEFSGQSELLFYHAILMVLLRRRINLGVTVARARNLWRREGPFLVANLDSRWLVSACDSIIDHWHEPEERALALAGTLFANTVKLYETERWATGRYGVPLPNAEPRDYRVPIHDGMSAFMIGNGDMVRNLIGRAFAVTEKGTVAGMILSELIRRASLHGTVFKRLRDVHTNPNTIW